MQGVVRTPAPTVTSSLLPSWIDDLANTVIESPTCDRRLPARVGPASTKNDGVNRLLVDLP